MNVSLDDFRLQGVSIRRTDFAGRDATELTLPASVNQDPATETLVDRDFMAWLPLDLGDGVIELDVASVLSPHAPAYARGFIGLAFRIGEDGSFESLYLRPLNSRVDDQVRRNHTVQYVAYPDFTFPRLRREFPEKYESYVDVAMGEWISLRVEIRDAQARLFVNGARQPCLVVTDLKLGANRRGGVGFWIEAGTIGYFSGLRVSPLPD